MESSSQVRVTSKRGSAQTPDELATHQALMQGTEAWQFMDGDKIVTVQPQGRFKADNATALAAAAVAGLGIAWLPDCITYDYVTSGSLVPIMTRYPPPSAGAYVIGPPGQHPARKVRVLTEMLIKSFELNPHRWGSPLNTISAKPNPKAGVRRSLYSAAERDDIAGAFHLLRHSLMYRRTSWTDAQTKLRSTAISTL